MNIMRQFVVKDAQVLTLNKEQVVTDLFTLKEIDCMTVRADQVAKFESEFTLNVNKDTYLTGIGSSFDTFFNHDLLEKKVRLLIHIKLTFNTIFEFIQKELIFNITIS